ncbi:hypothetical protein Godav_024531 [Gossypium davidsonii]|uniref:Uncharacterized protein n=1 Tax=Gossypium davidsonii TaxID=34287 RepID=A0A7J8T6P5_GOSDV|nr:hypothetical protein [Gossypium davidsonii]
MESKGYRKLNLTHKSHLLYCFSAWVLVSIITTATTCQRDSRSQIYGSCTQTTVSTSTISTQLAIRHDNLNLSLCFFSWTADFRFLPFAQAADSICSQGFTPPPSPSGKQQKKKSTLVNPAAAFANRHCRI